ncbi:MAG: cupin domain-containing protein [Gammaproteobacteria bacterium]|nr:cupin domain-containing protein [Gammaproteobacteria bacterium]
MTESTRRDHKRSREVLPADLLVVLLEAVPPATPDAEREARMRQRIQEGARIQSHAYAVYYTVPADSGAWLRIDPRLEMKILYKDARATSFLLRLQPGARLPAHVHAADEECLVLEGELRLGEGVILKAGDYHFAPTGLPHGAAESPSGALLFLRSEKPVYGS